MKTVEYCLRFDEIIVSRGWRVFPRHSVRDCLKSYLSGYTIGLSKLTIYLTCKDSILGTLAYNTNSLCNMLYTIISAKIFDNCQYT